jgi:DNA polymerase III alpha subunit
LFPDARPQALVTATGMRRLLEISSKIENPARGRGLHAGGGGFPGLVAASGNDKL